MLFNSRARPALPHLGGTAKGQPMPREVLSTLVGPIPDRRKMRKPRSRILYTSAVCSLHSYQLCPGKSSLYRSSPLLAKGTRKRRAARILSQPQVQSLRRRCSDGRISRRITRLTNTHNLAGTALSMVLLTRWPRSLPSVFPSSIPFSLKIRRANTRSQTHRLPP